MKKGFTLIELLAVIVILAIIATIATPIVLSIIEDTKESALLRSAEFYLRGVEQSILNKSMMQGGIFEPNVCIIQEDGNLICDEVNEVEIEVNGEKPSGGNINFKKGVIEDVTLTLGEKNVSKNEKGELFSYVIPDKICNKNNNPVAGSVPSGVYVVGDEYVCQVNEESNYNFIIVNSNEEYVYLMAMNDPNDMYSKFGFSPWISKEDFIEAGGTEKLWNSDATTYPEEVGKYTYGPVTALKKLDEITKDWYYIPKLNEMYTDETDHYTIYLSGRARLLAMSEGSKLQQLYYEYFQYTLGHLSDFWLMETTGDQTWYWSYYGSAWTYEGVFWNAYAYEVFHSAGIVPVIKLPKSKIAN